MKKRFLDAPEISAQEITDQQMSAHEISAQPIPPASATTFAAQQSSQPLAQQPAPRGIAGRALPKRVRRRIPEIAMGLFLVLCGGVLAFIFARQDVPSRELLALARDVNRGDVLSVADLAVLEVPADVPVAALSPQSASQILGASAAGDYPSGMLLTRPLLTEETDIPAGMVLVGARLEAGQYPILGFSQGDRVNIMARGSQETYGIVASNVEVHEVTHLTAGTGASLFATFVVPEQQQTQVVSAIGSGSIRLGLVPNLVSNMEQAT